MHWRYYSKPRTYCQQSSGIGTNKHRIWLYKKHRDSVLEKNPKAYGPTKWEYF